VMIEAVLERQDNCTHLPTAPVDAGADADRADIRGGGDDPALASRDGGGSSKTVGSMVGSCGPEDGPAVDRLK
jgi:hypothetical protein